MKKFLRGTKASLITLSNKVEDPTARTPAVGVFTTLSDENSPCGIPNTGNSLSVFMIDDIAPASSKDFDGRVKVFFYAPSRQNSKHIVEYNFVVPVQYLATAMALSALNEPVGGMPIAFFDSEKIKANDKVTMETQNVAFFLGFPMKESQEGFEISEKLEALISKNFTTALAPIPWDMVASTGGDDPSSNLNTAQGIMFNHLIALARGDIGALMEIMAMEKYLEDSHGDFEDLDGDFDADDDNPLDDAAEQLANEIEDAAFFNEVQDDEDFDDEDYDDDNSEDEANAFAEQVEQAKYTIYPLCLTIASTMLDRIRGYNPRIKGVAMHNPEVIASGDYEPQVDLMFNDITSSLEDVFKGETFGEETPEDVRRREDISYWDLSIEESCPSMIPLFEYIDTLPDKDIYRELLNANFTDEHEVAQMLALHGIGKSFTAMAVIIASYALKKGKLLSRYLNNEVVPAPEILSSWIGVSDTNFVWELPSLAHSLARYDTANAVDVLSMHYKPMNEMGNAVYLWNSIYFIVEMFEESVFWANMSKEEFRVRLNKLEDKTAEFQKFKSWLQSFFDVIKNDDHTADPEKQNETHQAVHEFFGSEEDVTVLANHVAKAFIAFVDIITMDTGLTPDDAEWNARRIVTLNHMLTGVAEHTGGRVDLAIR